MPTYTVQDTATNRTITFDWNDPNPPTDADMEEVFAAAGQFKGAPSAPEAPAQPTRGQILGEQAKNLFSLGGINPRSGPIPELQPSAQDKSVKALQAIGGFLGLDKPAESLGKTAAYLTRPESLTPEMAQEAGLKPSGREVAGTSLQLGSLLAPFGAIKQGLTALGLPKIISAALAGATGGYAYEAGEKISKGEAPTPGLTTALSALVPAGGESLMNRYKPKGVTEVVKHGIDKGIRPSVAEVGKTAAQNKTYFNKAQKAVETIVGNKDSFVFIDDAGNTVKGALPKSLSEFSQAVEQTKKNIFTQYDTLAQKAGSKGAVVDLNPVIKELAPLVNTKAVRDLGPEIINYANKRAAALFNRKQYTATEAQEAISLLNNSLEAYYKNPSYDLASKAYVDALIANKLRSSLDDVIEKSAGAGYQELKNTYGSLKAIEHDVNRRAIVDARKNIKGLIDFSDVGTGAAAVKGITNLDPSTVAAAATAGTISRWYKHINDPNRIIKNMFEKVEKAGTTPARQPSPFDFSSLPTRLATYNLGTEVQEKMSPRLSNSLRSFGTVRP